MNSLYQVLKSKGYVRTKFTITKTNHLTATVILNGVKGSFIIDTGASNSCLGFDTIDKFNLVTEESDVLAAGAGATDMITRISKNNEIAIGSWKRNKISLVLFDMMHVNTALQSYNVPPVDGIVGSDLLKKGKAILDYNRKYVYLKL